MNRRDEELWMKKLKEVMADYSEPPAPNGWSRLEKEIAPAPEKRIYPYRWWAVAATVLLAVAGASLFFMESPTADEIRQISTYANATDNIPEPDELPETLMPEVLTQAKPETKPLRVAVIEQPAEVELIVIPAEADDKDNVAEPETIPEKEPVVAETPKEERRMARPSSKDKLHLPVENRNESKSRGKWSVSASVSNAAGTTVDERQQYLVMASSSIGSNSSNMLPVGKDSELLFEGGVAYLRQSHIISEVKHKQPISFGLSVRRNLWDGFSVESGVMYTLLSSEGKSVRNPSQKIDQKLHYIGIPIRANWSFIDSKRFTVYLTAGGAIEKCVYGKIGTEKHTVKPLQFSLAGGVGGQLNLTNRFGVYIEPGAAYFFDDGSDVETIRKENKLNFNLQAGVRINY